MDKNYYQESNNKDYLIVIDIYCKQSWGDFTIKICFINKNKIGMYSGADILILERIK
ncbi:MAG: hypothetical protein Q8880_12430 [Bacteroidota bacterium]|nr:hypothetical protein [Bacteroidota bacterium]